MMALLFALFTIAMGLAWGRYLTVSYVLFGVAMGLSIYWFKFHATSVLTIQL